MLVVLMALKTLELRARRDAFVVFFLGFFLGADALPLLAVAAVAVAMLVSVWGLLDGAGAGPHAGGPAARCGRPAALAARTACSARR